MLSFVVSYSMGVLAPLFGLSWALSSSWPRQFEMLGGTLPRLRFNLWGMAFVILVLAVDFTLVSWFLPPSIGRAYA